MGDTERLLLQLHQQPGVPLAESQVGVEHLRTADGEDKLAALVQEPGAEGVGGHIGRSQPPSQQCRLKGVAPQTGQPLLAAAIGPGKGAVDLQLQGERSIGLKAEPDQR